MTSSQSSLDAHRFFFFFFFSFFFYTFKQSPTIMYFVFRFQCGPKKRKIFELDYLIKSSWGAFACVRGYTWIYTLRSRSI